MNISAGSAVHQSLPRRRLRVHWRLFRGDEGRAAVRAHRRRAPGPVYGLNIIGLQRRGFSSETLTQLRKAYRYLLQSKLNTTQALSKIEKDAALSSKEVAYLVDFIRTAQRGVIIRRGGKKDEGAED